MDQHLIVSPPYIRKPTALIHFERELSVIAQKVMTLIVAHCQKATKNDQGFYFIEKRRVCEFLGWEESHNQPRAALLRWVNIRWHPLAPGFKPFSSEPLVVCHASF